MLKLVNYCYSAPFSLDKYFRDIGRAGRDGKPAKCVIYYSEFDKGRLEYVTERGYKFLQLHYRQL